MKRRPVASTSLFWLMFMFFILSSGYLKGQSPAISIPTPIEFTEGVTNTPVVISNTGGAIPNEIYGVPVVVAATGVQEPIKALIRGSDGSFYALGISSKGVIKVTIAGTTTLLAGSPSVSGYVDGPSTTARFMNLNNLVLDATGNIYVTEENTEDPVNSRIRKITPDGTVSTFASGLRNPQGIAIDANGSIYVSEGSWIRKYSPSGTYTIFAGQIGPGYSMGQGTDATFTNPGNLLFDQEGNLYVGEGLYQVRKITPSGYVSLISPNFGPGKSMVRDAIGNFYTSSSNGAIFRIIPGGYNQFLLNYGASALALSEGNLYYLGSQLMRLPIVGYQADPPLPAGISFNPGGTISGIPTSNYGITNHTIIAHNTSGSSSAPLQLNAVMQKLPAEITSFTPTSAIAGSTITINGARFFGTTGVTIGGVPVYSYQIHGSTKIIAVMGSNTPSGDVKVINPYGTATLTGFTFIPPPVVASFTPIQAAKGTLVTISGQNFSDVSQVSIGNAAAAFTIISPTTIQATVGNNASSGDVRIQSPSGTGIKNGFEFIPPPTISAYSRNAGLGAEVIITGTGFSNITAVKFGGSDAQAFTVISSTSIKATVGTGSSGDITVTGASGTGTKSGFLWVAAPIITSISPVSGKQGDNITINGSNLENVNTVNFGGVAGINVMGYSTMATARVGSGASGAVEVVTPGGTATLTGFTFIPPPSITSFSPASGRKGDIITLTGTNFKSPSTVSFGNIGTTLVNVISPTVMEVTVPSGSSGVIRVTDAGGQGTINGFVHTGPSIASFSPQTGGPGTIVTISGQNFTDITKVTFGDIPATSFTVTSPTTINAVVGAGQAGQVVVTGDYGIAGSTLNFQHTGPTIVSVSNSVGYSGAVVTISGTKFNGTTAVSFGGTPAASFTIINDATIRAVVSNLGSTGDIVIETPHGNASRPNFTYLLPPTITSITPASGGFTEQITITGTDFRSVSSVRIAGVTASFSNPSNTSLVVNVPFVTTSGDISVTTPAGSATRGTFTHTGPKATSISSATGIQGQTITLTGENFTGTTQVTFGSVSAISFTVISSTELKVVVPPLAGNSIQFRTPLGSGTFGGFTFIPPPTISTLDIAQGGEGIPFNIKGTNFTNATAVSFGGVAARSFVVNSPTSITALPANGASGDISVVTPAGTAYRSGFILVPKPIISSISRSTAPSGAEVIITGTNLSGLSSVKFGSKHAAAFNITSSTTIKAMVGDGESGNITVVTPGGTDSISGFTYIPKPTISSFIVSGEGSGSNISITGTNLTGATSVKLGGVDAASFTVVSSTAISALVGIGSTGSISIVTPGGQVSKDGYYFQKPPSITSFQPNSGPVGTIITILGSDFGSTVSGNRVYFGTVQAEVLSASSVELKVKVPPGGGTGSIRIINVARKLAAHSTKIFRISYSQSSTSELLYPQKTEIRFADPTASVKIDDFDNDGKNDIILVLGGKLNILRNTVSAGITSTSFPSTLTLPRQLYPRSYGLGDVNGDGLVDIISSTGTSFTAFINTSSPGMLSFQEQTLPFFIDSETIAIRDIDVDGKNDLVIGNQFCMNTTLHSGSNVSFSPPQHFEVPGGGSPGDAVFEYFDNDDKPDLVRTNSYGRSDVGKNNSMPGNMFSTSFNPPIYLSSTSYTHSELFAVDLNGDDKPEIVESDRYSGSWSWHINNYSSGALNASSFTFERGGYPEPASPSRYADLDGDGKIDFYAVKGKKVIMAKNITTPGNWSWNVRPIFEETAPGDAYFSSIAVGDLDGDGKPEMVIVNSTTYKLTILHSHPPPVINDFLPVTATKGDEITITGSGFSAVTKVSFGGVDVPFTVVSPTNITAVLDSAATGEVRITANSGFASKAGFTYLNPSSVSTLSGIVFSSGLVSPTFSPDTLTYVSSVGNNIASVKVTATATSNTSIMKLNGVLLTSGVQSPSIALNVGTNTITIISTAENGITTTTYNFVITRAPLSNVSNLSSLILSKGVLSPVFSAEVKNYSVSLGPDILALTVTPTTMDTAAGVTVNGLSVSSGSPSVDIALKPGNNIITVMIMAQDTSSKTAYSISVTRLVDNKATLSALTLSTGMLSPVFAAETLGYNVAVPNTIQSLTLTPTATSSLAKIKVNGIEVGNGNSSGNISLNTGSNTIGIQVTAADGITTVTYNLNVTRAAENNAALAALTLSSGTLSPVFSPGILNYTTSVTHGIKFLTVTPTAASSGAAIKVNGIAVGSGAASGNISLNTGSNKIELQVTAADGVTAVTYMISVTKVADKDAALAALTLSNGTLSPLFSQSTLTYTASVPYVTKSLTVTPTAASSGATIKVNGVVVGNGIASGNISLNTGSNKIEVQVTAADSVTTANYSITMTRTVDAVATLSAINLSNGSIAPGFSAEQTVYTASVPNTVQSLTINPTVTSIGATVKINGTAVTSGTASGTIGINVGTNLITLNVTANDGITSKSYNLTVVRAAADQVVTDTNGKATVTAESPKVVITSPSQPVTVTVPTTVTNPSIDYSALVTGGVGTLPQTVVNTNVAGMTITGSTTVTSSNPLWNGVINAPTVTTYDIPGVIGEITTTGLVIEVGDPNSTLTFDKAVRLVLPGQAGMRAAFVHKGVYSEITTTGAADTQAAGDALPPASAFKINVGADLVIWTKGFSRFITFSRTVDPNVAMVASDKDALTGEMIKGQNSDLAHIVERLNSPLPQVGSVSGSKITWVSDKPEVISNDGSKVTRPVTGGNTTVTMTATLSKGLITETLKFVLTVLVIPPPVVSAFSPIAGKSGSVITITGTDFSGATVVTFGSSQASSFVVNSATSITATVDGGSSGTVTVTTPSGTTSLDGFTFIYALPTNNFKIQATGESCKSSNNGSVSIVAAKALNYTATITGNNISKSYSFSTSLNIQELFAGTYTICITVDGVADYKQCYEVMITEPKDLAVFVSVNKQDNLLELIMEGGTTYNVELNGHKYTTTKSRISLPLADGDNNLRVTTDKDCQGLIEKTIQVAGIQPYPNPFTDDLHLDLGNRVGIKGEIEIMNLNGNRVFVRQVIGQERKISIDVSHLQSGLYLLRLKLGDYQTIFKVLKK